MPSSATSVFQCSANLAHPNPTLDDDSRTLEESGFQLAEPNRISPYVGRTPNRNTLVEPSLDSPAQVMPIPVPSSEVSEASRSLNYIDSNPALAAIQNLAEPIVMFVALAVRLARSPNTFRNEPLPMNCRGALVLRSSGAGGRRHAAP